MTQRQYQPKEAQAMHTINDITHTADAFRPLGRVDFCFAAVQSIPEEDWTVNLQMSLVDQACDWYDQHGEPLEGETLADCRRRQDEEIDRIDAACGQCLQR